MTISKRQYLQKVRTDNYLKILKLLSLAGTASRIELASASGLSQMTVSRITKKLLENQICFETYRGDRQKKLGRKTVGLRINPNGRHVLCLCLSAFSKVIAVVDLSNSRLFETEIPKDIIWHPDSLVNFVSDFVDDKLTNGHLNERSFLGAAVVVAGSIDRSTGNIVHAPLLDWKDFPIKEAISRRLNVPVVVENIANALCRTCIENDAQKNIHSENICLVHVAAGMGASIAVNGKLLRRQSDENWIGKIPINPPTSKINQSFSLSEICSGEAILKKIDGLSHEKGEFANNLIFALKLARDGDDLIKDLFFNAGRALGSALFPITAAYVPDKIILAGPTGASCFFAEGVKNGFSMDWFSENSTQPEIITLDTKYIDAAQSLGISSFFRDQIFCDKLI